MFNIFFFQNLIVYEIMWKSIVEPDRPHMRIRCMCLSCWLPKAANTYAEHIIFITFPLQHWLHERASMLRYTYIVCVGISIT